MAECLCLNYSYSSMWWSSPAKASCGVSMARAVISNLRLVDSQPAAARAMSSSVENGPRLTLVSRRSSTALGLVQCDGAEKTSGVICLQLFQIPAGSAG
jgi:hypothetical protein